MLDDVKKIPCIKYTPELWKYIKPYLEEWDYKPHSTFGNFALCPLLVINVTGNLGLYNNLSYFCVNNYDHELVTDVEEFLERAAKLKGFTYKRKDIMKINGIEIKPGMVITTTTAIFITFPTEVGMAFMDIDSGDWIPFVPRNITMIQDISKGERITTGAVLWKKPEEVVITIDQIAEKFGYSAEQIKIKK